MFTHTRVVTEALQNNFSERTVAKSVQISAFCQVQTGGGRSICEASET